MKTVLTLLCLFCVPTFAQTSILEDPNIPNMIEDLNPFDPNIEETLKEYDRLYEEETGKPAHLEDLGNINDIFNQARCYRADCTVWVHINKATQQFNLYVGGSLRLGGLVSTGSPGHGTPNFDRNPSGRIYDAYSSSRYPGGDYNGLGNMPYAVFIQGGFAIHGTPQGNWPKLGRRASHGCIRMHPDNGYIFNRLVRQYGASQVWITVL